MREHSLINALTTGAMLAAICALALAAQTQINYNLQVARRPTFQKESAQVQPDGTVQYFGDPGHIRMATVPIDDSLVKPGLCSSAAAVNIPAEMRQIGAPSLIFTPSAVYACLPDGTGQGFRLARLSVATSW